MRGMSGKLFRETDRLNDTENACSCNTDNRCNNCCIKYCGLRKL